MDDLELLAEQVKACTACDLRYESTNPVPGYGECGAKYMLIGEAPGRNEDEAGMPFVGKAGRQLNEYMELAGIEQDDCYLTNVCRCRPPKNRTPKKAETRSCLPYLWKEIELVNPEYIITLGATPLALFTETGVRQMHGSQFRHELDSGVYTIISMYHPSASNHQPRLRADMLDDWSNLPTKVDDSFQVVQPKKGKYPPYIALDTRHP